MCPHLFFLYYYYQNNLSGRNTISVWLLTTYVVWGKVMFSVPVHQGRSLSKMIHTETGRGPSSWPRQEGSVRKEGPLPSPLQPHPTGNNKPGRTCQEEGPPPQPTRTPIPPAPSTLRPPTRSRRTRDWGGGEADLFVFYYKACVLELY